MKRWRLMLAGIVALPLLASCAQLPAGADGDLTNNWANFGEPVSYEPKVGTCLSSISRIVTAHQEPSLIVDCAKLHAAQIVGVGQYPAEGSSPALDAANYAACDGFATTFLKEDWRNGAFHLLVSQPRSASAANGARWWQCLVVGETLDSKGDTPFQGDLAAGIPATMRFGCQTATSKDGFIENIKNVSCAIQHHAEYAGSMVFPVGTPFPTSDNQWERIHEGCQTVVGKFVGVSPQQTGIYSDVIVSEKEWSDRRDVRCFAWFSGKSMVGSAKGTKGKGVPW
jgi:hypothetical protein